jgi:hypothetical protein
MASHVEGRVVIQERFQSDLSVLRRAFLATVLAAIVLGHAYCLLSRTQERWPFSRYAMYSAEFDPRQAKQYVLVGVEASDPSREIELFRDWEYLRPHYRGSLHWSFKRLAKEREPRPQLTAAAAGCLLLYEQRRVQRLHGGPALAATRVYLYRWRYADADPGDRRPTDRQLLAEAWLPNSRRSER